MPSRIDLFTVGQDRHVTVPPPRLNLADPLPKPRTAAQYDTSGPQRSKILL